MDTTKTISQYLQELSSNSPTPGGGNVAALCGALSSSLAVMVCNLTIGKKKYIDVEQEMKSLLEKLSPFSEQFLTLGQKDNDAFDMVMEAFKLPKDSEVEKSARAAAIESATIEAALVPATVLSLCSEILPCLISISSIGNQNSLSDAAVGISLIQSAAEGAYYNILINCASLRNPDSYSTLLSDADERFRMITSGAAAAKNSIIQKLKASIQ